jgi:hypothetical protein
MNASQQAYYNQIRAIVEAKGGVVISDRYEKMINKMLFRCQNGHEWDTEARSILKGMWCRYCHGNTREQGEDNFRQRVAEKGGTILGTYAGNHVHVLVQCKEGHQWEMKPHNLTTGKWCPTCAYRHHGGGSARFVQTLTERGGKLLGKYINSSTRVQVQCDKGHIWEPKPYYIVIGNWCPFCTGSSGENAIATYLSEKGIICKPWSVIGGLPRKRFDFILEYKGQNIIIEYDGKMHFKYYPYYHVTEEYFKHRQTVDRVKTWVALNSGYKMIRIDDWQLLHIRKHLDIALERLDILYLATPELYQGWLAGAVVTPEEIAEVNEGRSRPSFDDDPVEINITDKIPCPLTLRVVPPVSPIVTRGLQLNVVQA